ncbi:glycoside hydrolase family 13 protein [Clostridium hydrogenum]|uniref:glycoside hydrolase family 13 protein n=1 Tax=Clostridium hydrogenum TaxID=2855764 RepID=UPI001F270B5A|nr:alpha-glucosidase [Clostridium hydrogenum]
MKKSWWKESVVYQIYPRSFKDSNGDGIGDLQGIIAELDYLKKLGVGIIWLSPIYKSPNDDNGYDISDYKDIMKEFGTMEDFQLLLEEAHKRNLKIVMDLVVNHTSDEHKWFKESRKSKNNKYRDYYIWRNGKNGGPPNNWGSYFSGSAWEYDKNTDMYYLHLFSKKQTDLNWENPEVRKEVFDMMKWWLDKGIDGFRMDVISLIAKDIEDGDDKPNSNEVNINSARVHRYLKDMNSEVLSHYDIMTVGETPGVNPYEALKFVGENRNELNMVFQFEHVGIGDGEEGKWGKSEFSLKEFKRIMSKWENVLEEEGWNSLYLSNHDQPRSVSRFGNDTEYRVESAKMLATCIHMMKGTPYIYQGEELGMTNVKFENIYDYRDIETINAYRDYVGSGRKSKEEMMEAIYKRGRDNARTPFQWDDSSNAGFTKGIPWIKVNSNYKSINAKIEIGDEASVFNYYRKLIALRKKHEIIAYGKYELILEEDENIYAYLRKLNNETLLVMCNFSDKSPQFDLPEDIKYNKNELLISNYNVDSYEIEKIKLRPYEARVYLINNM